MCTLLTGTRGVAAPFVFLFVHTPTTMILALYLTTSFCLGKHNLSACTNTNVKHQFCGCAGATPLSIVTVRLSVSVSSWKVKPDPTGGMEETRNGSNTSPPFSASAWEPFCASWRKWTSHPFDDCVRHMFLFIVFFSSGLLSNPLCLSYFTQYLSLPPSLLKH